MRRARAVTGSGGDQQHRPAMLVQHREERLAAGRVDRNHVGVLAQARASGDPARRGVDIQGGEHTGLGGDVEDVVERVDGEHVGIAANREPAGGAQVGQGEHDELGVAVAGDERAGAGGVEDQAVVVVAAGHRPSREDGSGVRVDDGDLVSGLHVGEDPVMDGVVADVAGFTAEFDRARCVPGGGVEDGLGAAAFVADPQLPGRGDVGEPVGVVPGRGPVEHGAAGFVERDELVGAGRGGEYPVQAGHDDHAVHGRQPGGDAHDASTGGVDLQQPAGTELGQEQPVRGGVEVGVVEPGRRSGQGHLRHGPQRQRHIRRVRATVREGTGARQPEQRHDGRTNNDAARSPSRRRGSGCLRCAGAHCRVLGCRGVRR